MRDAIYYWKCDRPTALSERDGVFRRNGDAVRLIPPLQELLATSFPGPLQLEPALGSGNHHTFRLSHAQGKAFVRVESGLEGDGHLAVESHVLEAVARSGVAVPEVHFTDATRQKVPFGVQVLTLFDCPDLNRLHQQGQLPLLPTAFAIGEAIARWQSVPVSGFGPFQPNQSGALKGHHSSYEAYFDLHLERHIERLLFYNFLSQAEADDIRHEIDRHRSLLQLEQGVLVHKDLAFWNIMGTPDAIHAFVDWDDAIAGDPCDDLSLLACFYPIEAVVSAVEGYTAHRALPEEFDARFHLHLLRNLIVKALIRCQSGIFDRPEGGFFLLKAGESGADLRAFTRQRLLSAHEGLKYGLPYAPL